MNPVSKAEEILEDSDAIADGDAAMIFAMLAVADGLQSIAHSIEDSARTLNVELGQIAIEIGRMGK
jgi:hypothetical protein